MSAELWIRNPLTCIRELAELCVPNIAWDRGYAYKNRLDPQRHVEVHYPRAVDYRILLVGDQGTAELRRGHSIDNPFAVYPTWEYGEQTIPELEQILAVPPTPRRTGPMDERPVAGQEHRVVIARCPPANWVEGKALHKTLDELREDYPDAIMHMHGTYSWRVAFGRGFQAADIDPVAEARRGRIVLPTGRSILYEQAPDYIQWVSLLGFTVGDLRNPQQRTKFNVKSAAWAAKNWNEDVSFLSKGRNANVNPEAVSPVPIKTRNRMRPAGDPLPGDKLSCDHCSLARSCKYFREGGVCTLPDSDGSELARHFKTRDSEKIIEGLGKLLAGQSKRLARGTEAEEANPGAGLDPEVTKIEGQLFTNAVKLAKLVDPALAAAGASRIQINNVQSGGALQSGHQTPAQLMAEVVRELEASGVARDEITPAMVAEFITGENRKAIEAASTVVP